MPESADLKRGRKPAELDDLPQGDPPPKPFSSDEIPLVLEILRSRDNWTWLEADQELQKNGLDTVEANEELGFQADMRDYGIGAQILVDLGVRKMKLITNNPKKMVGLEGYGLSVVEQLPIEITPNEFNKNYLKCKQYKMGHMLRYFSQKKSK